MFNRALLSILLLFIPAGLLAVDIDGEVRLAGQSGLPKPAMVQLLHDRQVISEQFTGLDGRFEFHSIQPNTYIVRASYEDMPGSEVRVDAVGANTFYRVPIITIRPPKEKIDKAATISVEQLLIPQAATKEYEKGVKEFTDNHCDRALPHFRKAVELAPKYGDAFNDLGNCLKAQGNRSEAETAYQKAMELNTTPYAAINLADLYAVQKRYDVAQQVVEAAISRDAGQGDLYFALARIHFEQGRLKEAEAAGLQAHARIHRAADVHLLLAKIYLAMNNQAGVIEQLQTYLKENPKGPAAEQVRNSLKTLPPQ